MNTATIAEIPHSSAAPQPPRSPDRVPERAQQEAGVREGDDETVVPAKRLEELTFLYYCCRHPAPPAESCEAVLVGRAATVT